MMPLSIVVPLLLARQQPQPGACATPRFRRRWSRTLVLLMLSFGLGVSALPAPPVSFVGAQITVPAKKLIGPYGLAVDDMGNLFIADADHHSVIKVPADGGPQTSVGTGLVGPYGVAVDAVGNVFIADSESDRVLKVPADGGTQASLGSGLSKPYGVAVDRAGNVFIADTYHNRVLKLPADGGPQTTVGTELSFPTGVAVDRAGNLFIADTNHHRVLKVPADGGPQITVPTNGLIHPLTVAVDEAGNVFIADTMNHRVLKVPADGGAQTTVPANGLNMPYGVAVDGAGVVFIADRFNHRVVEVQSESVDFGRVNLCLAGASAPARCQQTWPLTYTLNEPLVLSPVRVLTQGAADRDFTLVSSTCTGSLAAGASCTVTVSLAPRAAGGRAGAVELVDNAGTRLVTTFVRGLGVGPQLGFGPGVQTTLGSGLSKPSGVAVDGAGNVFVTDTDDNRVVKVPADRGPQTTVGSGLRSPTGVAVDGAGNVFVTDNDNSRVVKVPGDGGPQTTVGSGLNQPFGVAVDGAGNVLIADKGFDRVLKVPADGGPQTTVGSGLHLPTGVTVDGAGNLFIADTDNQRVVKVPANGSPQISVGSGLSYPSGVAADAAGNVFIADANNDRVVKVAADGGGQTTVGSGLNQPFGVAVDGAGNLFIADTRNNRVLALPVARPPAVRFAPTAVHNTSEPQTLLLTNAGNARLTAVAPGLVLSHNFTQVPGNGAPPDCTPSFALAPGSSCTLSLAFAPTANGPLSGTATLTDNAQNGSPATQTIALSGTGVGLTQTITFNPIDGQVAGTQVTLSAAASSSLPVAFTSLTLAVCTVSGNAASLLTAGTCTLQATQPGNAVYAPAKPVTQSFAVRASAPATATMTSSANPSILGQTVVFTVVVESSAGGTPTGSITVSEGAIIYGSASLTNGVGLVSVSDPSILTVGRHEIRVTYGGDVTHPALTSPPFVQVVKASGVGGPRPVPHLTLEASAGTRTGEQVPVSLVIINDGRVDAQAVTLSHIALRPLAGSGEVTLASPVTPIKVGRLASGAVTVVNLVLQVPLSIQKLSLVENGAFRDGEGTVYRFSPGQVVFP